VHTVDSVLGTCIAFELMIALRSGWSKQPTVIFGRSSRVSGAREHAEHAQVPVGRECSAGARLKRHR
jgi:hypothetical protein